MEEERKTKLKILLGNEEMMKSKLDFYLKTLDLDKSGKLEKNEIVNLLEKMAQDVELLGIPKEINEEGHADITLYMAKYDVDKSGSIEKGELFTFLKDLWTKQSQ